MDEARRGAALYGRGTSATTPPAPPGAAPGRRPPRRAYDATRRRSTEAASRGRAWVDSRDPASRTGAGIGWVQRYRAGDGQLYALLLAAYTFLTLVPLLLVYTSYAYADPHALARRIDRRLSLGAATARTFDGVLSGAGRHGLAAFLIAVVDLFFFGLGFGRVLQLAHGRAWSIDLRKRALVDPARYVAVLAVPTVLLAVYVLQTRELRGVPTAATWVVTVVWLVVLTLYLVWAPWLLLDHRVAAREILPGAVFTLVGLVGMRILSGFLLKRWLESYSRTYGGFGFVMALFFWLVIFGTVLVLGAALSPALAQRRALRRGEA